jgi:2-octaprenylphenol hydroxylase
VLADAVIVGGGLVGALTALLLGAQGRSVVVVERERPQRRAGALGLDIRTVAVSPASQQLLSQAGVWQQLGAAPYAQMRVCEERGTGHLDFAATSVARDELGWICENSDVVCALWSKLVAMDNVELRVGEEIQELSVAAEEVVVELAGGRVCGKLLVGADGSQSSVRTALGIAASANPTGHHALATVIRTERGHGAIAWQKFLLDGPLALLPSREAHLSSVVWSQPEAQAERRRQQDVAEFCAELELCMEQRLGRVEAVDHRMVFPISQMLVESFNPEPRVLLIGDAARAIHPLAGLGANVGFEDVKDLIATAAEIEPGADLGIGEGWRPFARRRRTRAQMMLATMTALRRVYAAPDPFTGLLRNTGVGWLNRSETVKRRLIGEALGLGPLASGLSSLASGFGPLTSGLSPLVRKLEPFAEGVGAWAQRLGPFVRRR